MFKTKNGRNIHSITKQIEKNSTQIQKNWSTK